MKIMFVTDSMLFWRSGIWYHRIDTPQRALDKRGHGIKTIALGKQIPDDLLNWADTVVFGRAYPAELNPVMAMAEFRKRGKRVLYDMDDDFWQVAKDNPSVLVSNSQKDQYEAMIKEADALITPSKVLAKKFRKIAGKKPIFICPNGIDTTHYLERPKATNELIIGYMGAASHWKDLHLIGKVLVELAKKHDFLFVIYGITAEALDAAMYEYKKALQLNVAPEKNEYFKSALEFDTYWQQLKHHHISFRPPEMHPRTLGGADFDIGLAPLEDTEFNRGKSCIKFYEYAAVGTVTLASDIEPYKSEVNYRAKNNFKDWYKKLEHLIVDVPFREKILKQQQEYVKNKRSVEQIGIDWEIACQRPGGLKILNQKK